eukprot:CAMPEP_0113944118 /NCGR_PEP_ID=MMETSP1339-20121228/30647_1 /TAXON_ID=94617 /ORGANISM="Fibrocapsa japonica" /LENGTH=249 /DNA_ID=CAMNT_0000949193 /DNA_START=192 /DNA_END=940 /DNA_ORIENTATION=- /assembly_acc=CAM_ASM_000762
MALKQVGVISFSENVSGDVEEDDIPSDSPIMDREKMTTNGDTFQKERDSLKRDLIKTCSGTNRGLTTTNEEKTKIFDLLERLEELNPNPNPCDGLLDGTSPLEGEWQLLFTNALDVLSVGIVPAVYVGQVYQNVNYDGSEITNIIDLQPGLAPVLNPLIGSSVARLKVRARGKVESSKRIAINFLSSELQPQTLLGRDITGLFSSLPPLKVEFPTQAPQPFGYVDTTYVDDEMRVARSLGENLFVLIKV